MNIKNWITQLPSNSVIVEAGAADGSDTLDFSKTFPNGTVYSFEPFKSLYLEAKEKTSNQKNVFLENAALGYTDEDKDLYISDRFNEPWGSSSLLEPKDHLWFHSAITFKSVETVKTISFDKWIKEKNIQKIDLAWLDMQGYEPILLQNSPIAVSKIRFLYTEVSLIETYEGVIKYPEYKDWLLQNGFRIVFEDLPYKDMGNVLFEKQEKI
jgi:FkbM family methyltransferase